MVKQILKWIPFLLLILIYLSALELNKNSLWGWILAILLCAGYIFLQTKVLGEKPFGWKFLGFAGLLALLAGVFFLSWPPTRAVPAVTYRNPVFTEVLQVEGGQIQGVLSEDGQVAIYTGVPYAAPPVGELRWKEPQDVIPWEGVLTCDHFAPMGMQPVNLPIYNSLAQIIGYHDYKISLTDNYIAPVSEDSLYLNIWQPAGATREDHLPVLVYIHGGSLQTGQPWYSDYQGETLAREGMIVVNMGYRLGVFGFLASEELAAESGNGTTGNYGLLDQIKALEWVQENIAAFGGDPDNVTLSGESAGSACVSALLCSPLTEGLFERAVMESSTVSAREPAHSFRLFNAALESGKELLERYGCASIQQLRDIPAEQLVKEASTQHHITIDGYVLSETPYEAYQDGSAMKVPLMHGFNAHEGAAFIIFSNANLKNYEEKIRRTFADHADEVLALYPASTDQEAKENWEQIYSAVLFTYGHYCLTRQGLRDGVPVYEYYFTQENGRLGSWHSGEEVYLYGNIPADSKLYTEEDRLLSRRWVQYLVNFASTGDPNGAADSQQYGKTSSGDDLPVWKPQTGAGDIYRLNASPEKIEEPYIKLYEILDAIHGY